MVQIFITGDDTGDVTAGSGVPATGTLFAFEWDFFANGFQFPSDSDLEDPILASWTISDPPAFGTASITSPGFSADWTYVLDESNPAVQDLEFGETLQDSFVVRAISVDDGSVFAGFQTIDITITGVCYAAGTLIETEDGPVAVEKLEQGQMVVTQDAGLQPIMWIGGQWYDEKDWRRDSSLLPVRISAGALGYNLPKRDLIVSQQHRILISGPALELYHHSPEALVAAKHLCFLQGVEIFEPIETLGYFHVLCDEHHLLNAEGTLAESLFLGDEALHSLSGCELVRLTDSFAKQPDDAVQALFLQPTCRPVLNRNEVLIALGARAHGEMDKQAA